ncbi:MAG: hypothetical protein VR78_06550 [Hoeflea sp. BRH_c9]|nr:MAG: hypothetical protein VR78_06550 [Hoeflea sp. BRH_c9]
MNSVTVRFVSTAEELNNVLRSPSAVADGFPVVLDRSRRSSLRRLGWHFGRKHVITLDVPDGIICKNDVVVCHGVPHLFPLAEAYARVTERQLLPSLAGLHCSRPTHAATIVCSIADPDVYSEVANLRRSLEKRDRAAWLVGFLCAFDAAELSFLMLKQLLLLSRPGDQSVLWINNVDMEARPKVVTRSNTTRVGLRASLQTQISTLIMNGHSRPHCGLIIDSDRVVGVCGARTQAESGKCFGGFPCAFKDKMRIHLPRINAARVYFNACFSARLGSALSIPPQEYLSAAAVRGSPAQYIGNYDENDYHESDVWWFIGLSLLGFSPAAAVRTIEYTRSRGPQEWPQSTWLLGDASSAPWPVAFANLGEVRYRSGSALITWVGQGPLGIARLEGRHWSRMARDYRLEVRSQVELDYVGFCEDPFGDWSLVLVKGCDDQLRADLQLKILKRPVEGEVEDLLGPAVQRLDFLLSCRPFSTALQWCRERLIEAALHVNRYRSERSQILNRQEHVRALRALAEDFCEFLDRKLVVLACEQASENRWNWEEQYVHRTTTGHNVIRTTNPTDGSAAVRRSVFDLVNGQLIRTQLFSVDNGIAADLPVGLFDAHLGPEPPTFDGESFRDVLILKCVAKRSLRVVISLQVQGEQPGGPGQLSVVNLEADQVIAIPLSITCRPSLSGFRWVRVYLSSEVGFGFVARPYIFNECGAVPTRA